MPTLPVLIYKESRTIALFYTESPRVEFQVKVWKKVQ